MQSLTQLTDASLHSELKRLAGASNTLTAQLLAHLGEVEARGIHRERACSSLYTYCVYELRMSEDEAQRRCRAARLARQFPVLLDMLADASLHLTGILLIGPHLTEANQSELLARARFRTKREIERLVAELAPCRDVPSRIVPLSPASAADALDSLVLPLDEHAAHPSTRRRCTWAAYVQSLAGAVRQMESGLGAGQAPPRALEQEADVPMVDQAANGSTHEVETSVYTPPIEARPAPCGSAPAGEAPPAASGVAELRYKVQFTADQAYVDLLEEARNLLQHELPARDLLEVQRRALELLVRKLHQRKYAVSERPRAKAPQPQNEAQQPANGAPQPPSSATRAGHSAPKSASQGRYIPAEIRRSVWQRDQARCAYVDSRGQRCREQAGLEFHHQHPHGRGGPASIDNLALRCRSHNTLAAEQDFGRGFIQRKRAGKAPRPAPTRASAVP